MAYFPVHTSAYTPNINCTHNLLEAFSSWMYKSFYHAHDEPIPKFESWDIMDISILKYEREYWYWLNIS